MQDLAQPNFISFSITLEKKLLENLLKNVFITKKQQQFASISTFSFANSQLKKSRVFSTETAIETLLLTDGSLLVSSKSIAKKEIQKSFFTFLVSKNDLFLYKKI